MSDPNAADIAARLSTRLRAARKAKGLSLEAVAQLSGVSRSMLSQVERGESSPTVATLWNLTRALGTDFAGLLDEGRRPQVAVTARADHPVIPSYGKGCTLRILSPPEQAQRHEIYDVTLEAGAAMVSEPHWPGCREHLTVLDGAVTVEVGGDLRSLSAGDTASYAADTAHAIRASEAARVFLVVHSFAENP